MICESLQSQLNNFTLQVFGTPVKSDLAPGVVEWAWPCGLDTGLESSPRGFDEGASCYFLRLFRDEIAKLAGPVGIPGTPGTAGYSGYAITVSSFSQPADSTPFEISIISNPVIKPGELVFIDRSGWYQVLWISQTGSPTLSLIQPMSGAGSTIPAGRFVIPVGPKGADQTGAVGDTGQHGDKGAVGDQGIPGIDGDPGSSLPAGPPEQNGGFVGGTDRDFFYVSASTAEARVVTFGAEPTIPPTVPAPDPQVVQFTLTVPGKYLFHISSAYAATGSGAILYAGLVNVTTPASNVSPDPAGDNKFLPGSYVSTLETVDNGSFPYSSSCIVTTTENYSVIEWQAFGKSCRIIPDNTTVTWVRLT